MPTKLNSHGLQVPTPLHLMTYVVDNRFIHTYLIPLDIAAGVDLKHLRRLRKIRENTTGTLVLEVILCGGESISRQELAALLWSHSEEIPQLRPRLHLASKWAAYTLQQYETFSRLWPVTMRTEAKRYSSTLTSPFLPPSLHHLR